MLSDDRKRVDLGRLVVTWHSAARAEWDADVRADAGHEHLELVSRALVRGTQAVLVGLEVRLREIGVIAALERAGFERGDEVVIGEVEFELDPV